MRTKMKLNRSCLLLAACLALTVFASTVPAEARTATGFNSYRVSPGSETSCIVEEWGAAVNNCSYSINLLAFETDVDGVGYHTISAWDYQNGYGSFTCGAVSFAQPNNQQWWGPTSTFNPSGQQQLNFTAYVAPGGALSLYCYNVPQGRGIATLNWNP